MWELAGPLGRALKNGAANIIFLCVGVGAVNFGIFWPTSGSGPFQLPVTLFSYVARRTLKNEATNINFLCGSMGAGRLRGARA